MTRRQPARKRALAALLLLACLLGAGLLALQHEYPDLMVRRLSLLGESPIVQTSANGPGPGQTAVGQPNTPPPPESRFAVVALRPLFASDRRPAEQPATPDAAAPGGPPTDLLVTGIVMAGEDSVAILEPARPGPQAEPALVVRVGDSVSGWPVEEIEAGRVILERDGERHEMLLIDENDPRRATGPRRAPAANQLRPAAPQPRRQQPAPIAGQPRQTPITPKPQSQPQPRSQPQPPVQKIPKIAP